MKIKISRPITLLSSIATAFLLSACGGGGDSTTTTTSITGQLVDNYVADVNYSCADGAAGVTDDKGTFKCTKLPVKFQIEGLILGEIDTLPADKQVFPQDLLHLKREDINHSDVIAMARFLQSCDEDNDTKNGIKIDKKVRETFKHHNEEFNPEDVESYAAEAEITLIDEEEAVTHLEHTTEFTQELTQTALPEPLKDTLLTPASTLTQEAKDTLSYMGNEERLAHDVYLELYNYHLQNSNTAIKQLNNIATKSEVTHIQTVQALINKYELDYSSFTNIDLPELGYKETAIEDMEMGKYDIQKIQELHDLLIAKGEQSVQDALEVGCMVEVTDIDDLLVEIPIAQDSNASDVVAAFEFLRDGSYSHYWAFDKGLKNMGIDEGCCSLGQEYCHPEYPTDTKGRR
jgi:hypothetical protein